jgi:hypothetical protein
MKNEPDDVILEDAVRIRVYRSMTVQAKAIQYAYQTLDNRAFIAYLHSVIQDCEYELNRLCKRRKAL